MPSDFRYLTLDRVAELLGMSPSDVATLCADAHVPFAVVTIDSSTVVEDYSIAVSDVHKLVRAHARPWGQQSAVVRLTTLYALKGALGASNPKLAKTLDAEIDKLEKLLFVQWAR